MMTRTLRRAAAQALKWSLPVAFAAAAFAQPDAGRVLERTDPVVRYTDRQVVHVTVTTMQELVAVMNIAESVWTHTPGVGTIDVQVTPDQLAAIQGLGLKTSVMIADLQAKIDAETLEINQRRMNRDLAWFQNYKNLTEINTYLTQLGTSFPNLVTPVTVGNSLQGRTVRGLRITGPDQPGNPKSSRPQLLFHGCQHAREWVSPMTIMFFADQLTAGYATNQRIKDVLDQAEIILVPVFNPDGYEYTWTTDRLWRKNRRNNGNGTFGVDNNRNWGYQWGGEGASTNPGDETYRGPSAFSEPETQIMRDLVLANPRLRGYIDFHSYSQLILTPWGWTSALPPDATTFDQLSDDMRAAILSVHGQTYVNGPIYTTIYPASGGGSDWAYGAGSTPRKIMGMSIELRDTGANGFLLPPDQIIPTGQENLAGILSLSEAIAFPVKFTFPDGQPATATAGSTTNFRVNVIASPGSTLTAGSAKIYTRVGSGSYTPANLTLISGSTYNATLPASSCGSDIEYYFEATTTAGGIGRSPASAPTSVYSAPVRQTIVKFTDACEAATGWALSAAGDSATLGHWENAVPQATAAQPGSDHSAAGTRCFITGAAAGSGVGSFDVDGGTTTLTSPTFDATTPAGNAPGDAYVSYWRWYSNDQGSNPGTDTMPVSISNNNGTTWTTLETVADNANAWVLRQFRINDVIAPSATMKLRFVAQDLGGGSVVEAAIDDLQVSVVTCPCAPADFNCDGFVNGDDFDQYVAAFESGDPAADFNGDGFITGDDFDAFVSAFEGG